MMDSVGRITLAARKGRGKDAAKEVYIAAFPVLRARFFERCKAAHMTGNAVMNRMAEEYLSDLAAGRDRSRELLSLVEGVKERMEQQGASGSLLTERFIARVPASVKDRLAENCEHYGCSVNAMLNAFMCWYAVKGETLSKDTKEIRGVEKGVVTSFKTSYALKKKFMYLCRANGSDARSTILAFIDEYGRHPEMVESGLPALSFEIVKDCAARVEMPESSRDLLKETCSQAGFAVSNVLTAFMALYVEWYGKDHQEMMKKLDSAKNPSSSDTSQMTFFVLERDKEEFGRIRKAMGRSQREVLNDLAASFVKKGNADGFSPVAMGREGSAMAAFRMNKELKRDFKKACLDLYLTPTAVLNHLVRRFIAEHK